MDPVPSSGQKGILQWRPKLKSYSLWDTLPIHLQAKIIEMARARGNGLSSFARKRLAKRMGWCKSCQTEACPGLQPLSDFDNRFLVYYCSSPQAKDNLRLQSHCSNPTGWM